MVGSSCTIQQACQEEHRRWKMRRIEACSIKSHSASSPWLDLSTTEQVSESVSLQCIAVPPTSQHHNGTASYWKKVRSSCVLQDIFVECGVWSVQCAVQQDEIDWSGTLSLSRQATNALEHHSRWWWWLSENITFIYDYQINVIGSSCPQREYPFKTLINYLMFYRSIIVLCCWNMNHWLQSAVEISI